MLDIVPSNRSPPRPNMAPKPSGLYQSTPSSSCHARSTRHRSRRIPDIDICCHVSARPIDTRIASDTSPSPSSSTRPPATTRPYIQEHPSRAASFSCPHNKNPHAPQNWIQDSSRDLPSLRGESVSERRGNLPKAGRVQTYREDGTTWEKLERSNSHRY